MAENKEPTEDKKEVEEPVDEVEDGEAEDEEPQAKKHNSGAVDLEKVTDFFEEKELIMSVGQTLNELIEADAKKQKQEKHDQAQRDTELAQVQVDAADVDLLVNEFELDRKIADRTLREHKGNVADAVRALLVVV